LAEDLAFHARSPNPPTAYVSLPSTPILPSRPYEEDEGAKAPLSPISTLDLPRVKVEWDPAPRGRHLKQESKLYEPPFSLWDYLREELLATDFDSHQELKWERVSNFLHIPLAMEKVHSLIFGLV
jgi:hypothetical protein